MSSFQKLGLFLFIIGFSMFNLVFWAANYQLTHDSILKAMPDEAHYAKFWRYGSEMKGKNYSNAFSFVNDLNNAFQQINENAVETFGISEVEIGMLVAMSDGGKKVKFELKSAESLFGGSNEVSNFKKDSFKNFGGWLDGKEFESKKDLQKAIKKVGENIQKYAIIQQKGFDRYQIKQYKYSITKASSKGIVQDFPALTLILVFGLSIGGALMYISPLSKEPAGIKNNGIFSSPMKYKGWLGIMTGTYLIIFYVLLYYFPQYMTNWIVMVDPVSKFLKGSEAGEFFLYGFLYTICILVMGVRMILKYRHSPYQITRTISVMFFQTCFAFLIPEIMLRLNQPYFDLKNIWPLDYDFFFDSELQKLIYSGTFGIFLLFWGIALFMIVVPVMTYFYGKRWYCSWVCGCGGLAETLGDPYRQLSDKSLKAWKIERWMIYGVLVFAVVMTIGVVYTFFTGQSEILGINTYTLRETYGIWIGAGFAGVVGTGFYPFMGNRTWCRFGCPLAAYMGIIQRFKSRFRITTNGGQCISCGNCSTYCEMGIDVRWYAQRGQNIVRASCVGCGVCSSVCPRGVLNLENLDENNRLNEPILIGNELK
jgi:Pyruvate/2-oxoacid:ferredoxin oxidoreductase delta subunit